MWPILVVTGDMLSHEAEEMPLPEYDHMIEQFATQRPDPSFGESLFATENAEQS
jgi:hypothetical protein